MTRTKKLHYGLLGSLAVCVLLFIAILVLGIGKLESKSHQLSDLRLQSRVVDDQLASLTQAKAEVSKYAYFKDVAKSVIPSDKDQAQAVVDIFKMADESGISLQNVAFPASTLGVINSSGATSSSSTAVTKAVLSQAKPVPGISGLYYIEITITPETGNQVPADRLATYAKMLDFLKRIENNRRTAQIAQVNIQPIANSPYVNFTLNINIFIKP
jgi:hypothetical protein